MDKEQKNKPKRTLFHKVVNVFISFFIFLIVLILIFIGVSQTKFFRDYLRDQIVSIANESINGTLSIGAIEGSIFSSLSIKDISIETEGDTLAKIKSVDIETSFLEIFFRKIYFRKIALNSPQLKLIQYENGNWNLDNLITPKEEEETDSSRFPFIIQVNKLQIQDMYFLRKAYKYKNSSETYTTINPEDLEIKNFNIDVKAAIDNKNSVYLLHLDNLAFTPNLKSFNLKKFSADFHITNDFTEINDFTFITDSSDINLSLRLDSVNFLENPDIAQLKEYPVSLELNVNNFNFDDLTSYVEGTSLLKGNSSLYLNASGKFGNIEIKRLVLDFLKTHLEVSGNIKNLDHPENLVIDAYISNSQISTSNAQYLLHNIELPFRRDLLVENIEASFQGKPTNFKSFFNAEAEGGSLNINAEMNLDVNPMSYKITAESENLNISSVSGINTNLNSIINVQGKGTSPEDLDSDFMVLIDRSTIEGILVDSLKFDMAARNKIIEILSSFKIENSSNKLQALFDFADDSSTAFNASLKSKDLNISEIIDDTSKPTSLNFLLSASGKNLNVDKMNAEMKLKIDSSDFIGKNINESEMELKLSSNPNGERRIEFSSPIIDMNVFGSFSINEAIELIQYESSVITEIIQKKVDELNPISMVSDTTAADSKNETAEEIPEIVKKEMEIEYDFTLKDLSLVALFIGSGKFDVSGKGEGKIANSGNSFSVNNQLDIDHMFNVTDENVLYLSNFETSLNFIRDNTTRDFDNLFGSVSLTGTRAFSNVVLDDLNADLIFNQSKLFFNISGIVDTALNAETEGILEMTKGKQLIKFSGLSLDFKGINWTSRDTIEAAFTPQDFTITNFNLHHELSQLYAAGYLDSLGNQNFVLKANGLEGKTINRYIPGFEYSDIDYDMNFQAEIAGSFEQPLMNLSIDVNKIKYENINLGYLLCNISYEKEMLYSRISFIDSTYNTGNPTLSLSGIVPVNLSFTPVEERFSEDKNLDLKIRSKDFNLSTFGNSIPNIKDQRGIVTGEVYIGGTAFNPEFSGNINVRGGEFRASLNNLIYSYEADLGFRNNDLVINNLKVQNLEGSLRKGTINGNGIIEFNDFQVSLVNLDMKGDIALLGKTSKSTNPFLYGDLFIETNGDLNYRYEQGKSSVKGSVDLVETDLVFATEEANFSNTGKGIVYEFAVDSTKIDYEQLKFNRLVSVQGKSKSGKKNGSADSEINYDLELKIENNAKIVFVFSAVANQKLVVEAAGNLKYVTENGLTRAQGSFVLLDGSYLDFFKKFDAAGKIRFESSLIDPFLDVTATYLSDWEDKSQSTPVTTPVAVKMRLEGLNSQIGRLIVENPHNLKIYIGENNISSNTPDNRYDMSNILTFILIGSLPDPNTGQLSASDRNLLGNFSNTATSFLGPILTNVLNSAGVNAISNIQIEKTYEGTRFNIAGRYKKFRYSLGGTAEMFNPENADIKVEYIFNPNFSSSLHRKRPVNSLGSNESMVEFGLKFKVEF